MGFIKSLLFAGGYAMLVRRTICFVTNNYNYSSVPSSPLAAFVAGSSLIFEPPGRQS